MAKNLHVHRQDTRPNAGPLGRIVERLAHSHTFIEFFAPYITSATAGDKQAQLF